MTWTPGNTQSRHVPWEPHTNRDEIFLCILPYLNISDFLWLKAVHYPTRDLLRRLGLLKQGVTRLAYRPDKSGSHSNGHKIWQITEFAGNIKNLLLTSYSYGNWVYIRFLYVHGYCGVSVCTVNQEIFVYENIHELNVCVNKISWVPNKKYNNEMHLIHFHRLFIFCVLIFSWIQP